MDHDDQRRTRWARRKPNPLCEFCVFCVECRIVNTLMMNPTRALFFCSATFLLTAALSAGAQNQEPSQSTDKHPEFPPGEGRELTMKVCSTCHTLDVVSVERFDLDGWKNTVDQMASMGADATEEQLDQIVQYLAKSFPAESK